MRPLPAHDTIAILVSGYRDTIEDKDKDFAAFGYPFIFYCLLIIYSTLLFLLLRPLRDASKL